MKQQFKKEDKSRRSGTGRKKNGDILTDMEAICGHRDNITPTVFLDSSKDDDHSDHSEGESINDTESSEIGKNVSMQFVFRYGNIGRSVMYFFFNFPTLSLIRICILL